MCKCGCRLKLLTVKASPRQKSRYVATFNSGLKVHFGSAGGTTYIDGASDNAKKNYLLRHKVNENWEDCKSAGSLSRYILWNKRTFKDSLADYRSRFDV